VRELQPGLWWWEAVHPEWTEEDDAAGSDWGPEVSSYAVDDGERLLLIDPTTPPAPVLERAARRDTIILLTDTWHERDAPAIAESLGAQVFAPPPDGEGRMPARRYQPGDSLPFGVQVFPGRELPLDVVLWIESAKAAVFGDTLIDRGQGLELVDSWLPAGMTRRQVIDGLQPLLALPVQHALPTHGPPADRAALVRALTP
jgi:glyoxylase-like metal-dependent hydrolase (beta-lactamase superfamily II)